MKRFLRTLFLATAIDSSMQLSRTDSSTNVPMEQAARMHPAVVDYTGTVFHCQFGYIDGPDGIGTIPAMICGTQP